MVKDNQVLEEITSKEYEHGWNVDLEADEAPKGLTIYGQENDNATAALARMNMILHDNPTAEIWKETFPPGGPSEAP